MIKEMIEKWEKEEHNLQYINSQKAKLIISFIQDLKAIQDQEEVKDGNKNV